MPDSLVVLCVLTSEQEGQMLVGHLQGQGLFALVRGAKEYAALVTGTDYGRYEILVSAAELLRAKEIFATLNRPRLVEDPQGPHFSERFFKQSLIYSCLALIVLPIVFNFISLKVLNIYVREAPPSTHKRVKIFAIGFINLMVVFELYFILNRGQ